MALTFQEELRDTTISLEELLKKHELSLKDAVNIKPPITKTRKKPRSSNMRYISLNHNLYYIIKRVKSKQHYYGSYTSLTDAIKVRDKLMEYNWDKTRLDEACEAVNVTRRHYKKKDKSRGWCRYTLWDAWKVYYQGNRRNLQKPFTVAYNGRYVPLGGFLDPVSCEIIHDLINEYIVEE